MKNRLPKGKLIMLTITSRRESAAEEKKRVNAELPAFFKK
jgi:hypothetical protein